MSIFIPLLLIFLACIACIYYVWVTQLPKLPVNVSPQLSEVITFDSIMQLFDKKVINTLDKMEKQLIQFVAKAEMKHPDFEEKIEAAYIGESSESMKFIFQIPKYRTDSAGKKIETAQLSADWRTKVQVRYTDINEANFQAFQNRMNENPEINHPLVIERLFFNWKSNMVSLEELLHEKTEEKKDGDEQQTRNEVFLQKMIKLLQKIGIIFKAIEKNEQNILSIANAESDGRIKSSDGKSECTSVALHNLLFFAHLIRDLESYDSSLQEFQRSIGTDDYRDIVESLSAHSMLTFYLEELKVFVANWKIDINNNFHEIIPLAKDQKWKNFVRNSSSFSISKKNELMD